MVSIPRLLTAKEYYALYPETTAPMELVNGEVITLPSPVYKHSNIVGNIFGLLRDVVRPNQLGKVQTAPTDVHFDERNILQPDVLFISKDNQNCYPVDKYLRGAPDLCVEVLSSDKRHDRVTKFILYEKHGVRECWIVDPEADTIEVYVLDGTLFVLQGTYGLADSFTAAVLPMLTVQVKDIFEE